jgi:hypothetical protein
MPWIAVTFYTEGTGYQAEVEKLARSCRTQDVPLAIYPVKNLGSWRLNLNAKSATILQAMVGHPGKDIAFIDADAVIRHRPALFDFLSTAQEWDLAVHYYQASRLIPAGELLSGTIWIANSDAGRRIVKAWDDLARARPAARHQRCLQIVLEQDQAARIYRLPASYTRIFDARGMAGVDPVIEHFQASRRFRNRLQTPPGPGPFAVTRGPR